MTPQNGDPLGALLLPVLFILGVGIIVTVGWLIWNLTNPKTDDTTDHAEVSAIPQKTPSPCFLGVRRTMSGGWEIDVEGEPYATLAAVSDPQTRADVLEALRALAGFARSHLQQQRSTAGGPVTAGAAAQKTAASSGASRPTDLIPGVTAPAEQPVRRTASPDATMPIIDLAHEIGEIIDEMWARSPALQGHAVRLQNVPGQGVAFVVDGVVYKELAEIPYPEVQALIHEATKEWERR